MFTCDACGGYGAAFVYNCYSCRFDLHVKCAALAKSVKREEHQHPLQLVFSFPRRKGNKSVKKEEDEEKAKDREKEEEDNGQEEEKDCLCGEEGKEENVEDDNEKEKEAKVEDNKKVEEDYLSSEEEKEEDNEKEEEEDSLCGICGSGFIDGYWAYFCKDCDYGVHLECATAEADDDDDDDNEEEEEEGSTDVDFDSDVAENLKRIAVQQMMSNNQHARMIRMQQRTMMNNTRRGLFQFRL